MKTRSRRTVKNTRNTGGEVRQDKKSENEEFYGYIKDLVHHPYVLKMKNYKLLSALSECCLLQL